MDRVREHERELLTYALVALQREHPDLALYGPMDAGIRCGVIPFNVPGVHPHDVAQVLDRSGVAVRAGHHCTMPLHERLELAGHRPRELQRLHHRGRHRRPRSPACTRSSASSADRGAPRIPPVVGIGRSALECAALMDDLYRDYILEHYRRPHNFGQLDGATTSQEGANPLCGDRITMQLRVRGGVIDGVGFTGAAARSARPRPRC